VTSAGGFSGNGSLGSFPNATVGGGGAGGKNLLYSVIEVLTANLTIKNKITEYMPYRITFLAVIEMLVRGVMVQY